MTTLKPPPTRPGPPPARTGPSAALVSTPRVLKVREARPPCPRIVFYAPEKWGKTTLAAFAPDPVILMSPQETGYDTLLTAGTVPAVPAEVCETWPDTLAWLDALITDQQGRKTVVLDAHGGFERLCHEFVCKRDFDGDWSERGFLSYHKGYEIAVAEWLKLLQRLDQLNAKGVITIILGHAKVKQFNNPTGAAYDRYVVDSHDKTWAATARWSDCILFGRFFSTVEVANRDSKKSIAEKKGKAIGGADRVILTAPRDAFVAGNRYFMDPEIWIDPKAPPGDMWSTLWAEIVRNKQEAQQ